MVGALLSIVIFLVVVGVLFWCAQLLIGAIPMDGTIKNAILVILKVAVVLIVLFAILQVFGFYDAGLPAIHHWRR
jgi:hypothetical protein